MPPGGAGPLPPDDAGLRSARMGTTHAPGVADQPKPPAPEAAEPAYRYAAFISYRHAPEDRRWAKWLHQKLETYRVP